MAMPDRSVGSNAPGESDDPAAIASAIDGADFVRVLTPPDGDAIAATGLLIRALADRSIPYQARVHRWPGSANDGDSADDRETSHTVTIAIGHGIGDSPTVIDRSDEPASLAAHATVRRLGVDPDPTLALAGAVSSGWMLDDAVVAPLLEDAGLDRSPGVASPTPDAVDGLAHSTLIHGPFSGDVDAVETLIDDTVGGSIDNAADGSAPAERSVAVASMAAVEAVCASSASRRAATALGRAFNPHRLPAGSFSTLEGVGDLLRCVAADDPGTAVALAAGHDVRDMALTAWRSHARRAHGAVRTAEIDRIDGAVVVRGVDGPIGTVARLVRDYRASEPIVAAVADGRAAVAVTGEVATTLGPMVERVVSAMGTGNDEPRWRTNPDGTAIVRSGEGVDDDHIISAIQVAIRP